MTQAEMTLNTTLPARIREGYNTAMMDMEKEGPTPLLAFLVTIDAPEDRTLATRAVARDLGWPIPVVENEVRRLTDWPVAREETPRESTPPPTGDTDLIALLQADLKELGSFPPPRVVEALALTAASGMGDFPIQLEIMSTDPHATRKTVHDFLRMLPVPFAQRCSQKEVKRLLSSGTVPPGCRLIVVDGIPGFCSELQQAIHHLPAVIAVQGLQGKQPRSGALTLSLRPTESDLKAQLEFLAGWQPPTPARESQAAARWNALYSGMMLGSATIPFQPKLAKGFPVRTPRQSLAFQHLLQLTMASAVFHQGQRSSEDASHRVLATEQDLRIAWHILQGSLRELLGGSDSMAQQVVASIRELQGVEGVSRRDIGERLNVSTASLNKHLKQLAADGVIAATGTGKGKTPIYRVEDDLATDWSPPSAAEIASYLEGGGASGAGEQVGFISKETETTV